MIAVYEHAAATLRPAPVACVALNCGSLDDDAARRAIDDVEDATGLLTGDVLRGDAPKLWGAVEEALSETSSGP
jgi:uncharacterized NAD-dependent epimerase/dehydratase family protein